MLFSPDLIFLDFTDVGRAIDDRKDLLDMSALWSEFIFMSKEPQKRALA